MIWLGAGLCWLGALVAFFCMMRTRAAAVAVAELSTRVYGEVESFYVNRDVGGRVLGSCAGGRVIEGAAGELVLVLDGFGTLTVTPATEVDVR